jgi:tryptophan 2,3-dioxygenase
MQIDDKLLRQLERLNKKYEAMGQDMTSYLEGLIEADYLTYWDYIHLDTLLTLQSPRTPYPDEKIFIIYHQITELYFNLILHELEQISEMTPITAGFFKSRLQRVINYFRNLIASFTIMIDGMDAEQFLKYRMALLPASGFQSAQYRKIEILTTAVGQLVSVSKREALKNASFEEQFENIYWKQGATELATGNKTLTLKQFENKYLGELYKLAKAYEKKTLWQKYLQLPDADRNAPDMIEMMKEFDNQVNVHWPLMHYKSAARYLEKKPEDIAATGGTNWQKYLPPRFQQRIFFPSLWTEEELAQWGTSGRPQ